MKIDEFLPDYDFCASYDIHISASPSVLYERLFWQDFNEVWINRILETVRTGKLVSPSRAVTSLNQRLQGTGFVMLAEVPNEELLMGIAGRDLGDPNAIGEKIADVVESHDDHDRTAKHINGVKTGPPA